MNRVNELIILAGGFGTRLQSVVNTVPKPMADIHGKPFLHYLLRYYQRQGVEKVVLSVGYLYEKIIHYFGNRYLDMKIEYVIENQPLGTGGAIKRASGVINGDSFFVANGDTFFAADLHAVRAFHLKNKADLTLVLRKVNQAGRYGSVIMDKNNRIIGFSEKNESQGEGFINGGIYIIEKQLFNKFHFPEKFSLEKDLFPQYLFDSRFFGKICSGYFIDIGVPEDYLRAQKELLQEVL